MNVFDYLDYYGDYTFKDKPFNEVDNLIFSVLSYVDLNSLISVNRKNKVTLNEVAKNYFLKQDKKADKLNILEIRQGIKLLNKIIDVKRFKDILVYNYCYIGDVNSQFSAVTFEISNELVYVSFEGTDQLVSGWKEDCEMAYKFPVDAHRYAIKYLNKNFTFSNKNIIVGGHSKGGNLALVASMYCNFLVKNKILTIYSNDGQGLRKEQIQSNNYNKIKERFIHIIPQNSIVGLLLRHDENNTVILSNRKGFLAHDAITWQVDNDHFKREKLSRFSEVIDEGVITWLDKYDDKQIEKFVNSIFKVLEDNGIVSLIQLKQELKLIFKLIKSSKDIDPIVKEMTIDLFKIINKTNKEYPWFI